MDELTIGDKIYVSSKKASKITGYAKDYVGQLCREGRVEARLVGRNWYVLESSLMEHRFGGDGTGVSEDTAPRPFGETTAARETDLEPPMAKEPEIEWSAPVYTREEPEIVPLNPKEPAVQEAQKVVSDMQTAWQEWFSSQKRAQQSVQEPVEAAELEIPTADLEEEYPVHIIHPEESETHSESFQPEVSVPLTLHREAEVPAEVSKAHGDLIDLTQTEAEVPMRPEAKARGGGRTIQALLIVAAGIALCIALIGTGAIGQVVELAGISAGPHKAFIEYLGGESSYNSISK